MLFERCFGVLEQSLKQKRLDGVQTWRMALDGLASLSQLLTTLLLQIT